MPQVFFKSGSRAIPQGVLELSLSGMLFPFLPSVVQVGVRSPSVDSDLISAYVVGEPSEDGFIVQFSAPISTEGYFLDWTVWAGEIISPSSSTLSLQYSDFFREVKRFLGYGGSSATLSAAQEEEIDDYVQAGVRQFYYPPAMEGVDVQHEWSFMRPVGQVTTTAGVSFVHIPDGFGRLLGNVEFSESLHLAPAMSCAEGLILERLATRGSHRGPPGLVCVRRRQAFGESGQLCEMLLWPVPDAEYVLTFRQESDSGKISETLRPFPLGGSRFSELVLESCLAIAEQRANDETGLHTGKFKSMLASAVIQDRKFSAVHYGPLSASSLEASSQNDFLGARLNRREAFPLTYKGATW